MADDAENETKMHPAARWMLFLEKDRNLVRIIMGLAVICALLFLGDIVYHRHAKFDAEETWGFYAVFGFLAFSFIILSTKYLKMLIARPDNYYGEGAVDREEYPTRGTDVKEYGDV